MGGWVGSDLADPADTQSAVSSHHLNHTLIIKGLAEETELQIFVGRHISLAILSLSSIKGCVG